MGWPRPAGADREAAAETAAALTSAKHPSAPLQFSTFAGGRPGGGWGRQGRADPETGERAHAEGERRPREPAKGERANGILIRLFTDECPIGDPANGLD